MVCPKPLIPSNSYIIYPRSSQVNYTHGTHIFLACRDGYYLKGSPVMVCIRTVWFKGEFSCIASCPVFGSIKNGLITHVTLKGGGEVEIKCRANYTLVGSPKLSCIHGRWNGSLPSCEGNCKAPEPLENGRIIAYNYSHDSSITFMCNSGYDLLGPTSLTCQKGAWNGGIPECKRRCRDPGNPLNGWRFGVNYSHGAAVQFRCKDGPFDLIGASRITCDEGEWRHPRPSCKARCSDPGIPDNGTKEGDDYRSRANVTFKCNPPLELIGSRVIFCQDGIWSDSRPTCSSCGRSLGLENNKNKDIRITSPASSIASAYRPSAARLNGPSAWCPSRYSYLQIDLGKDYKLMAIATQGGTRHNRWIKKYRIAFKAGAKRVIYSESGATKDIEGNKDASSPVKYKFKEPFVTSTVWIYPLSVNNGPICLRMELYGCDTTPDCILVGSMVWGLWVHSKGAFNYYLAYVTKFTATHVDFVLKLGAKFTRSYKRTDQVLIVDEIPKQTDITVNTLVIAQHRSDKPEWYRSGTIVGIRGVKFASVRFDDGKTQEWVQLDYIRIVKRPRFCNDNI